MMNAVLLPHLIKSSLKSLVGRVYPPNHLQTLLSLLLHYVPQQCLQFFILIIPCSEHFKASHHDLRIKN